MRRFLTIFAVLMLFAGSAFSQGKTVTGTVTDESGGAIPFATVTESGTKNATTADANGQFSFNLKGSGNLVISAVGYNSTVVIPVNGHATATLSRSTTELSAVTVTTALGIQRRVATLPYAAQQIDPSKVAVPGKSDINAALAGNIAGVQISAPAGAKLGFASAIRIRGAGSLTDKNPLYVVDGTPVNVIDLNMDDVQSVTVLKGPNATALYGQRADAGVVEIVTKKGRRASGIGIELNSTTTIDKASTIPHFQNRYGGGDTGGEWLTYHWSENNPVEWKAFDGMRYHDNSDDSSWGPAFDGGDYIPWYAWYPGSKYSFKTAKWDAQPNNVKDFFKTGSTYNNNIALSKAGENFSTRFSYTNLYQNGILPNTNLQRNYLSSQSTVDLSSHFTAGANVFYTNEKVKGEFDDQYSNPSSGNFSQWFHRDLDMGILKELQDFKTPLGAVASWNHANPNANTTFNTNAFNKANYWFNPYFYFNNIDNVNNRDRLFGDVNLTYKYDSHFKVAAFFRRNQVTNNWENKRPYIMEFSGIQVGQPVYKNSYATGQTFSSETNFEGLASYNNHFGDFSIDLNAGGNIRKNFYRDVRNSTNGGLVVPDLYTISNSKSPSSFSNYREYKTVRSVYGRGNIGYKDFAFLDFSGRNDWSSALPADKNSYFYPSVGASILFSKLITNFPALSYGKIRGGWAQVGSDLNPYGLDLLYAVNPLTYGTNILMDVPNTLPNSAIMPALSSSYEAGVDLKFFSNRAGISFTYYKENKINEILNVDITSTSGFTKKTINAGKLERNGFEITLEGSPVQTRDFVWNSSFNFAKNTSKVIELTPDIHTLVYSTAIDGTGAFGFATIVNKDSGATWGQLRGTGIKKNANGVPILNADGTYQPVLNDYFGSVLPDFTGGFFNSFSYKNVNLAIGIDFQKGGKFFSLSEMWGNFSGLYKETAELNDKGKNVRDPVADGGGVHVKGVDKDNKPVDMYVEGYDYFHQFYFSNKIAEPYIHDASYIKLRSISFGYDLPVKKIFRGDNNPIQKITVSLVGQNLWLLARAKDNTNWDPSELGNKYGENGGLPSTRSYGFSIKLGF